MDSSKVASAVSDLLTALDITPSDHTADTPDRVARMWSDLLAGYQHDPAELLARTFTAPADPGLVMVAGIRVTSTCAHHLLPITGTATVAYRPHPGDRVVGLSKLARLVECYARRLQVQEQLAADVADALHTHLAPVGAGCIITAEHGCMSLRGVTQPGAVTTTHAWRGTWTDSGADTVAVQAEHQHGHRSTG